MTTAGNSGKGPETAGRVQRARAESGGADPACPLVSILVLSYNNIDGIPVTLDSVFRQDYARIQIVISDDGSGDFAAARGAIEDFAASRAGGNVEDVVVNAMRENVGTVKHTNAALALARGKYVLSLAPEDAFIGDSALSAYVKYMEGDPECDVCFGKLRGVMPDGSYKYELLACDTDYGKLSGLDRAQTLNRLFRRNFLPAPAAFIRADAYARFGMHDEDMRLIEDYPYWINLALQGAKFGYLDEYTVDYMLTGQSSAGEYGGQFMRDLCAVYDKYIFPNDRRFGLLQGTYNNLKRWGLAFYLAKAHWGEYGRLEKARKAVFYSPLFAFTWAQRKLNDVKNGMMAK